MNKIVASPQEAVKDIPDGARVMVGGFAACGGPNTLVKALIEKGAKDLTIICTGSPEWMPFVENDRARMVISGFTSHSLRPEITEVIESKVRAGLLQVETVPHGILSERIRANKAGIPAFYTPIGVGTVFGQGKEIKVFVGKECVLERAIDADYALIVGHQGDRLGNIACRYVARNRNVEMPARRPSPSPRWSTLWRWATSIPREWTSPASSYSAWCKRPRLSNGWTDTRPSEAKRGEIAVEQGLTRELVGLRIARELKDGMYVNLGFGLPTLTSLFIRKTWTSFCTRKTASCATARSSRMKARADPDLINAAAQPTTLLPGASIFDFNTSFMMIRGGHLDVAVLGAYQVSEKGDLANWQITGYHVGGIGGAIELAQGVKRLIVAMEHTTKKGEPRIVKKCSYPLTAPACVDTIVTNLAYIEVVEGGTAPKGDRPRGYPR